MAALKPVAPRKATLWEIYLSEGGPRSAPLARALLSDANIDLLTHALRVKAAAKLGALSPAPEDLTLARCDAFANAVMTAALDLGDLAVNADTLGAANKQALEWTMVRLTTEQSTFQRWRAFAETGVEPLPRPEFDTARADRKELQHPLFGTGLYSPWDAYAEERKLFDVFRPFNGLNPQDVTDSDDLRIKLVPWAPPAVHGQIPWPNTS